jgi:hypothetical protein
MPFPYEPSWLFPLRIAAVVDVNTPAAGAGAKVLRRRERYRAIRPRRRHLQLSRKAPFYHLLERRRTPRSAPPLRPRCEFA